MNTMKAQILKRIEDLASGKIFTAKDFLDIASRGTTDMVLSAMVREGRLRRIKRGLFDVPRVRPALGGVLSPDIDQTAQAIARRHRWNIVPAGTMAENLLGLSTQVPAKIVYLSDGPNKSISVGRSVIHFKHARPQTMSDTRGKPMLVIQALRSIGKDHVDGKLVEKIRRQLSDDEKRQLTEASRFGVDWIFDVVKEIVKDAR